MVVESAVKERVGEGSDLVNEAVTVLAAFIDTVHLVGLPETGVQLVQLVKVEPEAAMAVRVTVESWAKLAEQVDPQLMPEGLEVTVPEPVPDLVTLRA
jgi:transcriptional regulator of heat shock response